MGLRKDALKYLRYKDMLDEVPEEVVEGYRALTGHTYNIIPTRLNVEFVSYDPYKSLQELSKDIKDNGKLLVSSLNNDSRLLPGNLNLKFRAVHDYLHFKHQLEFNYHGEREVYKLQKTLYYAKYYSLFKKMLYSEIVLQTAYKEYFGKFAEKQKVII